MKEVLFLVKAEDQAFYTLKFKDILCIKIEGKHLHLITTDSELKVCGRIDKALSMLPSFFKRVHASYIINVRHLDTIQDSFTECKVGSYFVPIGPSFRQTIENQIRIYF